MRALGRNKGACRIDPREKPHFTTATGTAETTYAGDGSDDLSVQLGTSTNSAPTLFVAKR